MKRILEAARSIKLLAAKEPDCVRVLKDVFKASGRTLKKHGDSGADCTYRCSMTDEKWLFELVQAEPKDYAILQVSPSSLISFGYEARLLGQNKLEIKMLPNEADTHYDEVVRLLSAKGPGNRCVRMRGKDYVFDYCPPDTMTVACSKGPLKTSRSYKVGKSPSAKAFADFIGYQADRYEAMFNPGTYDTEFLCDPLKLKKHAIYYVGDFRNIVVSPSDSVTLLTEDGERSLEMPEGMMSRNVRKSFRTVAQAMRSTPSKGDIHKGFAHLLAKRGLLP